GKKEIMYLYCSGVWINKDTILTALHCAQAAGTVAEMRKVPPDLRMFVEEVKDPTGVEMWYIVDNEVVDLEANPKATHKSKVIAIDPPHDLALVRADSAGMPEHYWLRV